ncbi:MAG TPA: FAD-dependent monooxygenase [Rubrivivax sp.]|nr:FAD-dependent monooxygenase [Rubrivivax sp.]
MSAPRPFVPYPFEPERHASRVPPLERGDERQRHAVVVVGAGPVGFCTAIGLAQQGVAVVLLEADESVCFGSRAITVSRRSLQILQRLGVLPSFLRHGLVWTGGRAYYRGEQILHFTMPQEDDQKLPAMINLAQYRIEQNLLERAQALAPLIDIRWQTRVTGLRMGDDGVELIARAATGAYRLHTDWVVAADGGRSFVREALGLKLHGTRSGGRNLIIDIRMASQLPAELRTYFDPPCNPGSTVQVHKQPDDVWRIEYQLRDDEVPDEAELPQNVLPRVQNLLEMMGENAPWAPIWTGQYQASALTLERYRHGRVLLAGDAAHLMPNFGVRGANSGIDDADNLAWKLALVVRGAASPELLDSYSQERVAAAHENLAYGRKSTEFMAPPDFAFGLMRTAVLGLAVRHPLLRPLIAPRRGSAICYRHSPLNAAPERSAAFVAGPQPGQVMPECPITRADGSLGYLTDLFTGAFTALWFTDAGAVPADLLAWAHGWTQRGAACNVFGVAHSGGIGADAMDHTGRLFALCGAQSGSLLLVRPDGHLLARWLDVPLPLALAEAGAALQALLKPEGQK